MGKQYRGPQGQDQDQGHTEPASGNTTKAETKTGVIKRLVGDKGFGFIRTENGQEHFFHRSAVGGNEFEDLQEGDPVTFVQGATGPKGLRAEKVQRAI